MGTFGLMLKSYGPDRDLAGRLVDSFHAFNRAAVPLTIVVPSADVASFTDLVSPTVSVIDEGALGPHLVEADTDNLRAGYINQQIVKLAFWELGIYDNYLVMDSDAVFIRPFGREDFMMDDTTPYTVLVEDNDLKCDPVYYREHWIGRERHLRRIQELIGLEDRRLLTCHNHQVFSSTVLRSMRNDFAAPRDWTYRDLIGAAPYEFSWYNFWLQKSQVIAIEVREPWFKMVHHEGQRLQIALEGLDRDDLARGYIGLVVNSSFSRASEDVDPTEAPEETLARYVSPQVLAKALAIQARRSARRRLGR